MDAQRSGPFRQDVKVIGLIGVAHGLSHFFQLALPSMFPLLKADFDVSYAALGALAGMFYLASGVTSIRTGTHRSCQVETGIPRSVSFFAAAACASAPAASRCASPAG